MKQFTTLCIIIISTIHGMLLPMQTIEEPAWTLCASAHEDLIHNTEQKKDTEIKNFLNNISVHERAKVFRDLMRNLHVTLVGDYFTTIVKEDIATTLCAQASYENLSVFGSGSILILKNHNQQDVARFIISINNIYYHLDNNYSLLQNYFNDLSIYKLYDGNSDTTIIVERALIPHITRRIVRAFRKYRCD